MQKVLVLCAALLMAGWSGTAEAKSYHGTYEEREEAGNPDNPTDPDTGRDRASNDPVKYNSDGSERTVLEQEEAERRMRNGEGSSGPRGQENMFPRSGKKH